MKLEKNPLCSHNSNECKSPFISCSSTPVERSFTCCWWAYDLSSLESKLLTASEFEASTQHCGHARLASERSLEHYLDQNIFFPKIIAFCLRIGSWGESRHRIQNMTQSQKGTEVGTSTPSATGLMLQYLSCLFGSPLHSAGFILLLLNLECSPKAHVLKTQSPASDPVLRAMELMPARVAHQRWPLKDQTCAWFQASWSPAIEPSDTESQNK